MTTNVPALEPGSTVFTFGSPDGFVYRPESGWTNQNGVYGRYYGVKCSSLNEEVTLCLDLFKKTLTITFPSGKLPASP